MMKVAYGLCGLKPAEFFDMTIVTFNRMVEAKLDEEDHVRHRRAREVCALVREFRRPRRPNLQKTFDELVGKKLEAPEPGSMKAEILAESQARARRQAAERRAKKNGGASK